jgi:hypothetical protein
VAQQTPPVTYPPVTDWHRREHEHLDAHLADVGKRLARLERLGWVVAAALVGNAAGAADLLHAALGAGA